jgi:hypothetical protein
MEVDEQLERYMSSAGRRCGIAVMSVYTDINSPVALAQANALMARVKLPGELVTHMQPELSWGVCRRRLGCQTTHSTWLLLLCGCWRLMSHHSALARSCNWCIIDRAATKQHLNSMSHAAR